MNVPALRCGNDAGQATVELVALIPVVLAITLAVASFLAGQRATEAADQAAVAAAIAHLQGTNEEAAMRAASPRWTRPTLTIRGGRARVRLRWRAPGLLRGLVDVDRSVAFSPMARRQ